MFLRDTTETELASCYNSSASLCAPMRSYCAFFSKAFNSRITHYEFRTLGPSADSTTSSQVPSSNVMCNISTQPVDKTEDVLALVSMTPFNNLPGRQNSETAIEMLSYARPSDIFSG